MKRLLALRKPMRKYCAHMNRAQRRRWVEQRLTLSPRVAIGVHAIPYSVQRQFTRMPMGTN